MTMADTIAVMNAGRLEQLGDPATLYENPRTTFVANFLGQSNLLSATVLSVDNGSAALDVQGVKLLIPVALLPEGEKRVWLGVRPEKLRLVDPASEGLNSLTGVVTDASFTGVATQYLVRMAWGQELTVVQQNDGKPRALTGATVTLGWDPSHGFALDAGQDAHAGEDFEDPEAP